MVVAASCCRMQSKDKKNNLEVDGKTDGAKHRAILKANLSAAAECFRLERLTFRAKVNHYKHPARDLTEWFRSAGLKQMWMESQHLDCGISQNLVVCVIAEASMWFPNNVSHSADLMKLSKVIFFFFLLNVSWSIWAGAILQTGLHKCFHIPSSKGYTVPQNTCF